MCRLPEGQDAIAFYAATAAPRLRHGRRLVAKITSTNYPNTLPSGLAERKAYLHLQNIQHQDSSADGVGLGMVQTE